MLVYYETYQDPITAIAREKQLKNWNRKKKILLIVKQNPKFEEIKLESIA
jgi:putative endonuclease